MLNNYQPEKGVNASVRICMYVHVCIKRFDKKEMLIYQTAHPPLIGEI